VSYLCLMFGKACATDLAAVPERLDSLLSYVEAQPSTSSSIAESSRRIENQVHSFGIVPTGEGLDQIMRIHRVFVEQGLALRFTSHGRPPQSYYPTYRQLLLAQDRSGNRANYLAFERDYRFLRAMQMEDRIVPVVADLSGSQALHRVAELIRAVGLNVTAFYTSNVEFYLMRGQQFERYANNIAFLPWHPNGVIIRSYFNRFSTGHPLTLPGHASTQILQRANDFMDAYRAGALQSYGDLLDHFEPVDRE